MFRPWSSSRADGSPPAKVGGCSIGGCSLFFGSSFSRSGSRWRAAVSRSPSARAALRLSHYLPLAIAIYLLAAPHVPLALLNDRFAPLSLWLVRLGASLTFAGIAFAI